MSMPITQPSGAPLLSVENLHVHFVTSRGVIRAVEGVSWRVYPGEMVALVGESGCGKSVTSLSIMGLVPKPGEVVAGEILFGGKNIADMKASEMRDLRGEHISMIFQQPTSALNPVYRAGAQIQEVFELHRDWSSEVEEEKLGRALAGLPGWLRETYGGVEMPAPRPAAEAALSADRLDRLERQLSVLTEAVRTLVHGLEQRPDTEPNEHRTARAARQAHELLLAGQS